MITTHACPCVRTLRGGLLAAALSVVVSVGFAADYYLDPVNGLPTNPGTGAAPWPSLETVFATASLRSQIQSGDVLHLLDGFHGYPKIRGIHDEANPVTIQPAPGASPTVSRFGVGKPAGAGARGWVISGLDISPENAGSGQYSTGTLVLVDDNAPWQSVSYITVRDCTIRAVFSIEGYTAQDWYARIGKGVHINAPHVSLLDNHIENTGFAITVTKKSVNTRVGGNFVKAFSGDAIRGLSNDSVYEYNWVQDSYIKDANHDDFFQSWSQDGEPVSNVIIRNNVFISRTDPDQPLYAPPQGIGCFDGFFEDWLVENNVIISQTWHGITFYGGRNIRVVNNTVLTNPYPSSGASGTPWIRFYNHKNGMPGYGNIARNNLTSNGTRIVGDPGQAVLSNNLQTTNYGAYFVDYPRFDVRLLATAPAVDAGTATDAPTMDIEGNPRVGLPDAGAHEYQPPLLYEGFDYEPTASVQSAPDSASDSGFLGTTWSGTNDIVSPGLSHAVLPHIGNALKFFSNVSSARTIDTSVFPPAYSQAGADGVSRLGVPGTTLWFAFLIRPDAADPTGSLVAGLNLLGAATGGTLKLSIGDVGTSPNWGLKKGGTVAAGGTPIVTGETTLLVARVGFVPGTNNDEVDLFVNPTFGATPPAPSAMLRNVDIGTFDRIEFKGNRTSTVDELNVVTEWRHLP